MPCFDSANKQNKNKWIVFLLGIALHNCFKICTCLSCWFKIIKQNNLSLIFLHNLKYNYYEIQLCRYNYFNEHFSRKKLIQVSFTSSEAFQHLVFEWNKSCFWLTLKFASDWGHQLVWQKRDNFPMTAPTRNSSLIFVFCFLSFFFCIFNSLSS